MILQLDDVRVARRGEHRKLPLDVAVLVDRMRHHLERDAVLANVGALGHEHATEHAFAEAPHEAVVAPDDRTFVGQRVTPTCFASVRARSRSGLRSPHVTHEWALVGQAGLGGLRAGHNGSSGECRPREVVGTTLRGPWWRLGGLGRFGDAPGAPGVVQMPGRCAPPPSSLSLSLAQSIWLHLRSQRTDRGYPLFA